VDSNYVYDFLQSLTESSQIVPQNIRLLLSPTYFQIVFKSSAYSSMLNICVWDRQLKSN